MGLTRHSAAVSVLLAMEEHRKQAGLRLKRLREGKGWSQPDLYSRSGVSVKTISRFENGHHDGRRNTIRQLAKALGVNETDIIGQPPSPLGLGAREDQTEDVRVHFEGKLGEMLTEIKRNRLEIQTQNELLEQHRLLLKEQTALLEELREERNVLKAVQKVLEALEAQTEPQPEQTTGPANGEAPQTEDRRQRDRRDDGTRRTG